MWDQYVTMPGSEKPDPLAVETVSQAQMTTQIPLAGKFKGASSPQSADTWPKWLMLHDDLLFSMKAL